MYTPGKIMVKSLFLLIFSQKNTHFENILRKYGFFTESDFSLCTVVEMIDLKGSNIYATVIVTVLVHSFYNSVLSVQI